MKITLKTIDSDEWGETTVSFEESDDYRDAITIKCNGEKIELAKSDLRKVLTILCD